MAKLTRTAAVSMMEAIGFPTASALSTGRLEKRLNRIDHITIDWKALDENQRSAVDFVLEAINNGVRVEVEEDRPDVPRPPKPMMTQRVPGMTGSGVSRFDRTHRKEAKYDWSKILDGRIVALEHGSDFHCKPSTFGMQVRQAAKKRKLKVQVAVRKDGVVVVQAERPVKP